MTVVLALCTTRSLPALNIVAFSYTSVWATTCILPCLASQVLLKQTEGRLHKTRVCGPAMPPRFNFLSCIMAYLQLPLIDYCDAKMTLYFNGSVAGITWKKPSGEVG